MPTYKNISAKRIMVAGVQTVATVVADPTGPPHYEVLPQNRWLAPAETIELSEEQAAALGARVALVETP
jgi:hypothetical protein